MLEETLTRVFQRAQEQKQPVIINLTVQTEDGQVIQRDTLKALEDQLSNGDLRFNYRILARRLKEEMR